MVKNRYTIVFDVQEIKNMKILRVSFLTFLHLCVGVMAERICPHAISTERAELGLELPEAFYRKTATYIFQLFGHLLEMITTLKVGRERMR